jgi:glutamine amidotransferase-like uncharacterized protein
MTAATVRVILASVSAVSIATALIACGARREEGRPASDAGAPILLFDGSGTSPGDVASIRSILGSERLKYATADSSRLNRMSYPALREYRLLIVPGGNFEHIGNSLTSSTTANIRKAVQDGLDYLGICAGAFFAGDSPYNGLNLTSGVRFGFYSAEARGVRRTAVAIASADGQTLDHYWEDGPQLTGWGAVVGKYPDGTPAIVEGTSGGGWVILTGVHPEAPAGWRRGMEFRTPADTDHAYAAALIRAALNRQWLPHY